MESQTFKNTSHQVEAMGILVLPLVTTIGDEITNFDNLRENLTEKLKLDNWIVVTSFQNLYIFNLNKKLNGNLSIRNTISIDIDMIVKVFDEMKDDILFNLKLCRWRQLQTLIEQLSNVKREDDLDFECIMDKQQNAGACYGFKDDCENITEKEATFEFCATNAETDTHDVYQPSEEPLVTTTVNETSGPLIRVKSEFTNFEQSQSISIQDPPYICSECDKEFDQNAKLMLHMRLHQLHICTLCNESVTGSMDRHIQRHYKINFYQCHICGVEYKNKVPLEKHMQKHSADDEFYCDICKDSKNFKTKAYMEFHMKSRHNSESKKVENFQIEWVQATEERLRKQYAILADDGKKKSEKTVDHSAANQLLYICVMCNKKFPTEQLLNTHMKRHDKGEGNHCEICNKVYYSSLSRHISTTHHKIKNHVCDICGSAYSLPSALKHHISTKHSANEGFTCDICENGKVYRSRQYLKKHLAAHARTILKESSLLVETREENKLFKCMKCNEVFLSKNTLKRHAMLHNDKNYKCEICQEILSSKYTLKSHKTLKHNDGSENAPQYKCKICDKKFGMQSSLTVHEKIHAGNVHICHQCGQSFKHPHYLRKHLHRHTRDESHKKKCTMCDKKYANNVDLRLHMKKIHDVIVKPIRTTTLEKSD